MLHELDRGEDGAEGIAQLVAEHRQEVIAVPHGVLELDQQVPDLVLAPPRAQSRAHRGEQRDAPRGPVEEDDVGERAEPSAAGPE